jgi:SAM-dependent methyltransferase
MEQKALWTKLQNLEWSMYQESPIGVFSVEGLAGAKATGEIVQYFLETGSCLDIGCGALPLPSYMSSAPDVQFHGIDPYIGDKQRLFPFKQGFAEELPYADEFFDGVLFATSLDHCFKPCKATAEAYRVLKPEGYLFNWITIRNTDEKYFQWYNAPKPCQYDDYHMWAFTEKSVQYVLKDFEPCFFRKIGQCMTGYEAIMVGRKPYI